MKHPKQRGTHVFAEGQGGKGEHRCPGRFPYPKVSLRPPEELNCLQTKKHQREKDSAANQSSYGTSLAWRSLQLFPPWRKAPLRYPSPGISALYEG